MTTARLLTPDDAPAYCELRKRAIVDTPWAFLGAPGDDPASELAHMTSWLANPEQRVLGVFDPANSLRLIAVAGISRVDRLKARHRAYIWGVYTDPDYRGRGYGRAVMDAAIDVGRSWPGVEIIALSASVNSPDAIGLYRSCGFVQWGVEPDAMRIDGRAHDEVYLQLVL